MHIIITLWEYQGSLLLIQITLNITRTSDDDIVGYIGDTTDYTLVSTAGEHNKL